MTKLLFLCCINLLVQNDVIKIKIRATLKKTSAILLFSRTAAAEAVAKPLAFGKRKAKTVAAFMVNHAKKLATKTDLPVFFFSEKQQRGTTFGERFANAFDDIFNLDFENVIAIGNDCLTVSTDDILKASNALETVPSVLGATNDGGAYLIGFQKSVFQKNVFQNIHWQTDFVFNELVQFIENQNFTPSLLAIKSDIDRISDWKNALETLPFLVKKILTRLLYFFLPMPAAKAVLPINFAFLNGAKAQRAPPIF